MDANQKLELLKISTSTISSLAWPGLVGIFLGIYRKNIGRFIDRVQKIGGGYFEASTGEQPKQQEEKPSDLRELEQIIQPAVIELKLKQTKKIFEPFLGAGQDREEALFKIIASLSAGIHYNKLSSNIFGSQLNLLVELNSKPEGLDDAQVKAFYEQAAQQNPILYKTYIYEQWVDWLIAQDVIEAVDKRAQITVIGEGFLNYLIKQKMSMTRPN